MTFLADETTTSSPLVGVLGPVLVENRLGTKTAVASPLGKKFLVSLALNHGAASTRRLVDDIWEDTPPGKERAALHTLVSRLRSVCRADLVVSTPSGYALSLGSKQTDFGNAGELLNHARVSLESGDPEAAHISATRGLSLWRGEPGTELDDSALARDLVRSAQYLRTELLRVRIRASRGRNDSTGVLDDLRTLLSSYPLDESLHLEWMHALADAGRSNEALLDFVQLKSDLADSLGSQPGDELVALNTELLRNDSEETHSRRSRIGLRAAATPLVGREQDVLAVEEMVAASRLTTILGPGGLGKTRLAHEVGNRSSAPAVIVVELASVRSDDDIERAFASTLGIREVRTTRPHAPDLVMDVRSRILSALSENETLLIVDNCEHIIEAVAIYLSDILSMTTRVRILTTSRSPLAVSAERVYPLRTLTALNNGSAVILFAERARAARPGVLLPEPIVTRLCQRLDGLPLALELAAARTRSLSVEEIERRVNDRFALLSSGDRSAPERHRTLRAVIEWSWNLLGPSEQSLLRSLSAFPGGFSAEAAEATAPPGTSSVFDDLDALVAQSLVSVIEDPETGMLRYRMLETVREFGEQQREDAQDNDIDDRINGWAIGFALGSLENMFGPAQLPTFRAVSAEQDNLISVLRRSLECRTPWVSAAVFAALGMYWTLRGAHSEVIGFGDAILDTVKGWEPENDTERNALASCYLLIGSTFLVAVPRTAFRARYRLRKLAAEAPFTDTQLDALARLLLSLGQPMVSASILTGLQRSSEPLTAMFGHLLMAQMHEEAGDFVRAEKTAAQAYRSALDADDAWSTATAAQSLGQLYSQRGATHDALEWSYRARDGFMRIQSKGDLWQVDLLIAMNLISSGNLEKARGLLEQASGPPENPAEFGASNFTGVVEAGLAEIALAEGNYAEALGRYEDAVTPGVGDRNISSPASNPWLTLLRAAQLVARLRVLHLDPSLSERGSMAQAARLMRTQILIHARLNPIRFDAPVLGTGFLAYALWMLEPQTALTHDPRWVDTGMELVTVALALHSRQDLASLRHDRATGMVESWWGASSLAHAQTAVASLSREDLVIRGLELLRSAR